MNKASITSLRGFTIIELLMVTVMVGLIIGTIYSLYITHQRSAYIQDEVVEVQQNLRIAMDSMARDIRMAGFLASGNTVSTTSSHESGPSSTAYLSSEYQVPSDKLALNGGTGLGSSIATVLTAVTALSAPIPVDSVYLPDGTQKFLVNNAVTVIRQQNKAQPGGTNVAFRVSNVDTANSTITLSGTLSGSFIVGDIIIKLADTYDGSTTYPATSTITYFLAGHSDYSDCPAGTDQMCLIRIDSSDSNGAQVVAQNIASVKFSYLMDSDSSTQEYSSPSSYGKIRAVRVRLFGQTVSTKALSGGTPKIRMLESVIHFRNRS